MVEALYKLGLVALWLLVAFVLIWSYWPELMTDPFCDCVVACSCDGDRVVCTVPGDE